MADTIKLGKLPAKHDSRTFKLSNIMKASALGPLPEKYEVDEAYGQKLSTPMFGNDSWGCCVIASRGHWTIRAEYFEQKKELPIATQEILEEYWKEGGGDATTRPDNGLSMLNSLVKWRKDGWKVGANKYNIYAFASIDLKNRNELCYAIMLLGGAYIGFNVPDTAMTQFETGATWSVIPNAVIEGGHAIYVIGWNEMGPVCVTWGRKQQMTWEFYYTYTDEAYAIVDNKNAWMTESPVDVEKLNGYLKEIGGVEPSPDDPDPPVQSWWSRLINFLLKLLHLT